MTNANSSPPLSADRSPTELASVSEIAAKRIIDWLHARTGTTFSHDTGVHVAILVGEAMAEAVHEMSKAHVATIDSQQQQIAALTAEKAAREVDIQAYRGALGYSVPGAFGDRLSDGTLPKNGIAEALQAQLYEPNVWVCATCGFEVQKMFLRAADGAVGLDSREVQDICPNDGTSLSRRTWQQACGEAVKNAVRFMDEAEALRAKVTAPLPAGEPRDVD
jgi:hypothetical protein